MKKGYDDYANRRNIPHLNLYTKLIGMFYFWTGTNFILGGGFVLCTWTKKNIW